MSQTDDNVHVKGAAPESLRVQMPANVAAWWPTSCVISLNSAAAGHRPRARAIGSFIAGVTQVHKQDLDKRDKECGGGRMGRSKSEASRIRRREFKGRVVGGSSQKVSPTEHP